MKFRWMTVLWMTAAALLAGCGGSGGMDGGGGASPSLIDPVVKLNAIKGFGAAYEAFVKADPGTAEDKLLVEVKKHPLVKRAEKTGKGELWAELKDGSYWTYVGNRLVSPTKPPLLPSEVQGQTRVSLPTSERAAVFCSLGDDPSFIEPGIKLAPQIKGAGYQLVGGTHLTGSVYDYLALSDIGLLYVDSHGSQFAGRTFYSVFTSTEATEEVVKDMGRRLAFMDYTISTMSIGKPKPGQPKTKQVISLTSQWFAKSKFLKPGSLVFLNTCHGGSNPIVTALNKVGVGLHLGWSWSSSDEKANLASHRFFDLTLNKAGGWQHWADAVNTMEGEGLTVDGAPYGVGALFVAAVGKDPADHLLPVIKEVTEDAALGRYILKGVFGSTRGVIFENGDKNKKLEVISWTPNEVRVTAKASTSSLTAAVGERKSQAFNLSIWSVSSLAGGPITAHDRVWIYLTDKAGMLHKTIIKETEEEAVGGPKGPFFFFAAEDLNLSMHVLTNRPTGSCSDIYLTSPSGKKVKIISAKESVHLFPGDTLVATSGNVPLKGL